MKNYTNCHEASVTLVSLEGRVEFINDPRKVILPK